jgi:hypothetical protein
MDHFKAHGSKKKRNWKPTRFPWPILKARTDPKFQTAFKYTRITAKVRALPYRGQRLVSEFFAMHKVFYQRQV